MNDAIDWTTDETVANVTADELEAALGRCGINAVGCFVDGDGRVNIPFVDVKDAEALIRGAVPHNETTGSLYDRSTSGCLTFADFAARGEPPTDEELDLATANLWDWTVHPVMVTGCVRWHVAVDMSVMDAAELTATLNRSVRA